MASSPEEQRRRAELAQTAPMRPRGLWKRGELAGRPVVYLCGTLGTEFDTWQRRLAVLSAADALFSQQIGLDAVEKLMDELETEARASMAADESLQMRRSPGYGERPLELSRTILSELNATERLGVSLTDSLLLVPSKTVTAICEIVTKEKCE